MIPFTNRPEGTVKDRTQEDSERPTPRMQRVDSMEAIQVVEGLAREIWSEHFTPILGEAQVAYMLDRIQSASAIAKQVRDGGYEYYLVADRGEAIGYFAIIHDRQSASMQLSKLYVKRSHRGRGLGRAMLAFVEGECAARGIRKLWLTVNKDNAGSIGFYRSAGFTIAGPIVTDIGSGFVMDDYKMQKRLD
jgi:ribosomal protein S18 acetylase RimI-like enzyme